jgi:hypothetical protein
VGHGSIGLNCTGEGVGSIGLNCTGEGVGSSSSQEASRGPLLDPLPFEALDPLPFEALEPLLEDLEPLLEALDRCVFFELLLLLPFPVSVEAFPDLSSLEPFADLDFDPFPDLDFVHFSLLADSGKRLSCVLIEELEVPRW